MRTLPTRIIRRRKSTPADSAFFKKESQEPAFFAEPAHETFFNRAANSIQRKCTECEKEEKAQRVTDKKEEEKKLQRMPEKKEEEEKNLKRKSEEKKEEDKVQRKENNSTMTAPVPTSSFVNSLDGRGTSLTPASRHFFEKRMEHDFSHVKIHTGSEAGLSAKEVNAKAYTIGNHIVFNEGQYQPESAEGRKLLAHELTHIVQNGNGGKLNKKTDSSNDCADYESNEVSWSRDSKGLLSPDVVQIADDGLLISLRPCNHNQVRSGYPDQRPE